MIRLLIGAGLPRGAASDLRERGCDAVHVTEIDLGNATDEAIMAEAASDHRTLVTLDNDLPWLLYLSGARRPSVLLFRIEGLDRASAVESIQRIVPLVEAELESGSIVSVGRDGARVRPLPIS